MKRIMLTLTFVLMLTASAYAGTIGTPNPTVTAHLTTIDIYSELPVGNPDGYQYKWKKAGGKWQTDSTKSRLYLIDYCKSNKKYYIKVRAYKKVNGKKQYSKWSKTKSVKTARKTTTYIVGKGIADRQYIYVYGNCSIAVKSKAGKTLRTLETYGVNDWAQYTRRPGDYKLVITRNSESADFSLSEMEKCI